MTILNKPNRLFLIRAVLIVVACIAGWNSLPMAIAAVPNDKSNRKPASKFPSTATRKPTRKMAVLAFEIGIEIGSRAFHEKSAYGGDLERARKSALSTVPNLDARYLHATGIKHTLGKVIIRTDPDRDPLRKSVTATGGSAQSRSSLAAFKEYWNRNPLVVGKTHDLAAYHTYYAPSGLAYVKSVGSDLRYATVGGRGPTSWANGTLCHEFGHSWGLKHTDVSGLFYESAPRQRNGAKTAGGTQLPISIMVGDKRNIGRLASDEAELVMAVRDAKHHFGTPYQPGPTKPFGKRDDASSNGQPVVIDVIANDYDVNNDVLDAALLDTVSHQGGTITLSKSTGPGGRNEIRYSPPPGGLSSGRDYFHYTVFDTAGLTDFGAVYIHDTALSIDLEATEYHYDLGPHDSETEEKFIRLSPRVTGDVQWSRPVAAIDRGSSGSINNVNRDFIYGDKPTFFRHQIADGTWKVIINMGDSKTARDRMGVAAEGRTVAKNINSPPGKFTYVRETKQEAPVSSFLVTVDDGRLDLKFFDTGGQDKHWVVTRISLKREP